MINSIVNIFKKIWEFIVWVFVVEWDEEELETTEEYYYDSKYFSDVDSDVLKTKMIPVYIEISKFLSGISSMETTYGIKYFNIEDVETGNDYTIINRINEVQRALCLTKVSTILNKETSEKEFITTYNIFNKDENDNVIKVTVTSYFKSISFNNDDRFKLLEASTKLVNGFFEVQGVDNLTRYTNHITSFRNVNELTRKEVEVEMCTYGNNGDFQTPTLMQYINSEQCQISESDMNCKYSCNYKEDLQNMVFDIIRKDGVLVNEA